MSRDLRSFRSRLVAALAFASSPCLVAGCCTSSDFVTTVPIFEPDTGFEDAADVSVDGSSDGDASSIEGDAADDAMPVDVVAVDASDDAAAADAAMGMDPACQQLCLQRGCGGGGALVGCQIVSSNTGRFARCAFHQVSCPTHPVLFGPICGRRPEGIAATFTPGDDSLGELFARLAWLERASVPAFARLAMELEAHGAPRALVRAAVRAERDEVRHADTMTEFALRHGAAVPPVEPVLTSVRDLESIAIENAREGCARETLGALVAAYQAEHAEDSAVRAAMTAIARDEAMHAWLASAVDAWIATKLDPAARARVAEARHDAIRELETTLPGVARDASSRAAGLPDELALRALIRGARETVWS